MKTFRLSLQDGFSFQLDVPESTDKAKPSLKAWCAGVTSGIAGDVKLSQLGEVIKFFENVQDFWFQAKYLNKEGEENHE